METMEKLQPGLAHKLPKDLAEALSLAEGTRAIWQSLTPIARNEFICWIEDAKQAKTRTKRIRRTIEELQDGKRRPCCWAGCIHRTDKKPSNYQQQVLINKKAKN
jgi:uncharacterized protein YdeI (YjbR/CyaY-like superfamily)